MGSCPIQNVILLRSTRRNEKGKIVKKQASLLGFIVLLLAGVVTAVYFGLRPRPVPKIRLSGFQTESAFAQSLILRLNEEIKAASLLVIGIEGPMPEQARLWQAFLEELKPSALGYEFVFVDQSLEHKGVFTTQQEVDFRYGGAQFLESLREIYNNQHRVVLVLPQSQSSLKVPLSYANFLKKSGFEVTAMTTSQLLRQRDEENKMSLPCIVEGVDETGLGPLGCLILQRSRADYRKKSPNSPFIGTVDLIGINDYLVLVKTMEPSSHQ